MRWLSRKFSKKKHAEIWFGIVRKAQANHDFSLDHLVVNTKPVRVYSTVWIGAAAFVLLTIAASIWYYRTAVVQQEYVLKEDDLKDVFADSNSVSRLVLSSGDTILLEEQIGGQSSLSYLLNEDNSLDFRRLGDEEFISKTQTLETGRGKQLSVVLPDGTKVWLNALSSIRFPARFEGAVREVFLSGEAYFEVAHDKGKLFLVNTEERQVRVLGTHFNLRGYEEETFGAVTLFEGAVEVSGKNFAPMSLKPSEQLVQYQGELPKVSKIMTPESAIAWKNDEFYFEDADAMKIVQELERWYPVAITIKKQINGKKISGRIKRSDSMKKVVEMLRFFDIELLVEKRE